MGLIYLEGVGSRIMKTFRPKGRAMTRGGTELCSGGGLHSLYSSLKLKTKLHDLSPRANYTDRATAACRRSDCHLFAARGCHVVSVTDLYSRILGFLDKSRYFSIK
jgi:hypothetical protein